jgi:hypothetical protein
MTSASEAKYKISDQELYESKIFTHTFTMHNNTCRKYIRREVEELAGRLTIHLDSFDTRRRVYLKQRAISDDATRLAENKTLSIRTIKDYLKQMMTKHSDYNVAMQLIDSLAVDREIASIYQSNDGLSISDCAILVGRTIDRMIVCEKQRVHAEHLRACRKQEIDGPLNTKFKLKKDLYVAFGCTVYCQENYVYIISCVV